MPFLSGVEATRRIRTSKDGILSANSDAHIIAVTTAVGDEPELTYRKAEMDGMIGKPVRLQHLQQYICPLAHEAEIASRSVSTVNIDGVSVMPPLPPVSQVDRVFYLPSDGVTPSDRPEICKGSDFEQLLEAQTRLSLRQCGAKALARTGTIPGPTLQPPSHHYIGKTECHDSAKDESSCSSSRSNSSSSVEKAKRSDQSELSRPTLHSRAASMTISRRTLTKQIAREVTNAGLDGESSDSAGSNSDADASRGNEALHRQAQGNLSDRPSMIHRASSPGWLLSEENFYSNKARPHFSLKLPTRPRLSVNGVADANTSSSGSSGDCSEMFSPPLRRESEVSSTSSLSVASSTVTTPPCDESSCSPLWSPQPVVEHGKRSEWLEHDVSNKVNLHDRFQKHSFYSPKKETWSPSSKTTTASSSFFAVQTQGSKHKEFVDNLDDQVIPPSVKYHTVGRKRGVRSQDALELARSFGQLHVAQ